MIRKLRISNFALIEHLELELSTGFTVLTGETGSGKSILLNAFSLITGNRSSSSVVGAYGKKAIVEILLSPHKDDHAFFEKNELDLDSEVILRREVTRSGKSRAFINDSPVSLSLLKEYTSNKLLVHSQYNTFELKSKKTQLELYDSMTGHDNEATLFSKFYGDLIGNREIVGELLSHLNKASKDIDYNQFLCDELMALKLDDLNYDSIEEELFKLENSEEIRSALQKIEGFSDDEGLYSSLSDVMFQLDKLNIQEGPLAELKERLNQTALEIKDIARESSQLFDSVVDDPERKVELIQQIDEFNRVLAKHKVTSQSDLVAIRDDFSHSSKDLKQMEAKWSQAQSHLADLEIKVQKKAKSLHESRLEQRKVISKKIVKELRALKLPHTDIEFEMTEGEMTDTGITKLNLLFSANLGYPNIEIEKAASGGELSRFMLALLKLISETRKMPTILFDEIDSGVSGDVANKIGQLLKKMGQSTQLIVISHLPQVASKSNQHFKVHKKAENSISTTHLELLSKEKRIEEVARLMSGDEVTLSAIETAKSLMN
jgi:DNA repair protein RecN (Recombination protein N)